MFMKEDQNLDFSCGMLMPQGASVMAQPRNTIAIAINSIFEGAMEGSEEMSDEDWDNFCEEYKKIKDVLKNTSQEDIGKWLISWGYKVTPELYHNGKVYQIVGESCSLFDNAWKLMKEKI